MSHPTSHFQHSTTYPRKRRRALPIVLGVIVAVLAVCTGAAILGQVETPSGTAAEFAPTLPAETTAAAPTATTKAAPAKPVKTTPAKPRPVTVDDGTWTVGEDIPAGTYKVNQRIESGEMCYWAITKTGSNGGDIIANDLPSGGRPSVVLKRGQTFETDRCGTWTKTK